jgi:TolB-like protein/Flp pilus assembly protein TadD
MTSAVGSDPKVQIAHVLTMDVVGYSTLLITEQSRIMAELTRIVKDAPRFRRAEAEGKLVRLPTGDGMVLVFLDELEAPIECAMEIGTATKNSIPLRMGIHSGPINQVLDVNDRSNVAGAGVDIAQRVMDCGDAGHILLSKRVADDLSPFPRWNPHLHELGECEVKHGRKISLVNLYTDTVGNPELPNKIKCVQKPSPAARLPNWFGPPMSAAIVVFLLILGAATYLLIRHQTGVVSKPSLRPAAELKKSIAVLPFENLSADPENVYFADGIQEEILTRLSKIRDLKVISRTSTQRYKSAPTNLPEIAKQLGVANILEGTVQKAGDQVRVHVQLINAATDAHLWSEKYDRKLTDIFAVESEIATNIAATLQAKLTGAEQKAIATRPTENSEAHQLYLKGRYYWNKRGEEGLKKAAEYFERAIKADPNYAPAYAGMADSYALLGFHGYGALPPAEAVPKAKAAAEQALQIDETLAEAHTSLAFAKEEYDWDWSGAEREYKRAIELNPNYGTAHQWYAVHLAVRGRYPEAIAEIKQAQKVDPLSLVINMNAGWVFYFARQYDEAVGQCRKTLELDPNFAPGHWMLGQAYRQKGMHEEAIAEFQKAVALFEGDPIQLAVLGHGYAVAGKRSEAQKIIKELTELSKQRYFPPYFIALIYVGLDDKDQAFELLEKAFAERSANLTVLQAEPMFDPVRSDARFQDLLRRVGFAP